MTATPTPAVGRAQAGARSYLRVRAAVAVPVALYAFALVVGLAAASTVIFPTNEGSAYYVAVARNLAAGRGLVIDSIWSYATPPLVLPRPAFELWQPLASFIYALPMLLMGGTFAAAQLGAAALGAAVAPLTWAITRDAAIRTGTPSGRIDHLAIGAGLVAALLAPIVLAIAVPDSTLPFLVFATLACWLAPHALAGGRWAAAALAAGVALGLAYLARHEAIYVGVAILGIALWRRRQEAGEALRRLVPAAIGGALVVGPWLARNVVVFGTPLPSQALDNAFLTANEQIFDYGTRPSAAGFFDQGAATIAGHVATGTLHNVIDVLLLPAVPVSLVGLAGVALLLRRQGLRDSALGLLLLATGITLAIDSLVFPVASMWGTFLHAVGPLLIGLTVAAVLVTDRLVDAIRRRRKWKRANAWLAPLALALVAVPMSIFQLTALGGGAATQQQYAALAHAVGALPEVAVPGSRPVIISDHPIWLNETTGLPTLALPAQSPETVLQLAHDQGATVIIVVEGRGEYPAGFRTGARSGCFVEHALPAGSPAGAAIFTIAEGCR